MLSFYNETEQTCIRENLQTVLAHITGRENGTVWMVLETVRDKETNSFLVMHEVERKRLFRDDDEELREAGASALCIDDIPEASEWIAAHWGESRFSFFTTRHDKEDVVEHMSSLCYLAGGEKIYLFRYYDPVTFACWAEGLKESGRVYEALGIFDEIYLETPLPHILKRYTIHDNGYTQSTIDLKNSLKGFDSATPKEGPPQKPLHGCWKMEEAEYDSLSPVSLNAFKIKLCKMLLDTHGLPDGHSLGEVCDRIDTEIERAVKYGMERKDTLAYFINICFEYPLIWSRCNHEIEEILQKSDIDETERLEMILKKVSKSDTRAAI